MNVVCLLLALLAAEVMPPPPAQYFNDSAHVVSPATAAELNRQLEDFERSNSSQILVAVFPKMQSDSSIEDYTLRVAQSWRVGQKSKDNGAVLFVFVQDRKMFLQVGYGLEGAIPDAIAKRIIEDEIKPRFRAGDFDGGLRAGVSAILQAARGEYKGTGHTVAERSNQKGSFILVFALIACVVIVMFCFAGGGTVYTGSGRAVRRGGWLYMGGGFGGGGGGGGFSGGSGGGFSGGGGSFGGGGAGGSW